MSRTNLNDEDVNFIFQYLKNNTSILKINLTENNLTDKCLNEDFKNFITNNKTIEKLEMDGNNFSEEGIDNFINLLKENFSLTDVSISELAYNDQLDVIFI
jgi:hypothetical protein